MYEETIESRVSDLAAYVIENGATVRSAASRFGISKSTVHKDLTQRLKRQDPLLYAAVREVLLRNKQERHLRGGNATKLKYLREKEHHTDCMENAACTAKKKD